MNNISTTASFCMNLAKLQTELSRRLDSKLNGISLNELIILYHLSQAPDQKLRRIDLADKLGLTASGITRLLLPMEKIGLIAKESNEFDARVSLVVLAPGGQTKLTEGLERLELFCDDSFPADKLAKLPALSELIIELNRNIKN